MDPEKNHKLNVRKKALLGLAYALCLLSQDSRPPVYVLPLRSSHMYDASSVIHLPSLMGYGGGSFHSVLFLLLLSLTTQNSISLYPP